MSKWFFFYKKKTSPRYFPKSHVCLKWWFSWLRLWKVIGPKASSRWDIILWIVEIFFVTRPPPHLWIICYRINYLLQKNHILVIITWKCWQILTKSSKKLVLENYMWFCIFTPHYHCFLIICYRNNYLLQKTCFEYKNT